MTSTFTPQDFDAEFFKMCWRKQQILITSAGSLTSSPEALVKHSPAKLRYLMLSRGTRSEE
jgi:hypothetical protein